MSFTADLTSSHEGIFCAHLCAYVNASSKIQVIRITNIPNWYFERVTFPGQKLVFPAPAEAMLEVHSGSMASSILSDTIPCHKLILEEAVPEEEPVPVAIAS